jgi:hypothetical protein
MTQQEINALEAQIAEAKKKLTEGPLNDALAEYKEKFEGKVILYSSKTTTVKTLYFTYYKEFYIHERYDKNKVIQYKGETLEISTTSYVDTISLRKKEDREPKPLNEMLRSVQGDLTIVCMEDYQRYRKSCPEIIKILHKDILGKEDVT